MKALDFITRIKNAVKAQRREFSMPFSKLNLEVGKVMFKEGFLDEIKEEKNEKSKGKTLRIKIAYDRRIPRFNDLTIISRPSLKKYVASKGIRDIEKRGRRTLIISTSQGVMTGREAQKKNLGGEILFAVW